MRQIIFDTETTGMNPDRSANNPALGHRVIEIGCVELIDRLPTKNTFHIYLNPEQAVDAGAFKVHGISNEFLADKPKFAEIVDEFLGFLHGADELIAHNIGFDQAFLNQELKLAGVGFKLEERFKLTDSLMIARRKHAGAQNNLDALCKRYQIDNSNRDLHGALLDARLLAEVYLKLTGGQSALWSNHASAQNAEQQPFNRSEKAVNTDKNQVNLEWLAASATEEEWQAHHAILAKLTSN